jgi:hypothetical protein
MADPREEDEPEIEPELQSFLDRAMDGLIQGAIDELAPDEGAIFKSDENSYAIVLTSNFNCSIDIAPDDSRYALYMNLGLAKFFKEMTRMLFSRINVVSESQWESGTPTPDAIPFEETVEVARVLAEAFCEKQLPAPGAVPPFNLGEQSQYLYEDYVVRGLRFALAHEFGHAKLAVSPGHSPYRERGEQVAEHLLKQATDLANTDRKKLIEKWGEEFAADQIGLELGMEVEAKENLRTSESHPPPHIRREHLRSLNRSSERRHDLGEALQRLVDQILSALTKDC